MPLPIDFPQETPDKIFQGKPPFFILVVMSLYHDYLYSVNSKTIIIYNFAENLLTKI